MSILRKIGSASAASKVAIAYRSHSNREWLCNGTHNLLRLVITVTAGDLVSKWQGESEKCVTFELRDATLS